MATYEFGFYFYTAPGSTVRKRAGGYEFEAAGDIEALTFAKREYEEQIALADYAMLTGPSGLLREW
jgi:hypothetical protein